MKLLLLAVVVVAVGNAQTISSEMQTVLFILGQIFDMIDTNNDNLLTTREEFAFYDFSDMNRDGCFDFEEYSSLASYPPEYEEYARATFYFYDTMSISYPADGCISRHESLEMFTLTDLNGDEVVDIEEFNTVSISLSMSILDIYYSMGLLTTSSG